MEESLILEDKKFGLIFIFKDGAKKIRHVKSKSHLEDNEDLQKVLEKFRAEDSVNRKSIKCLCIPQKNLYLSAKMKSNGKYYIQNYKGNAQHNISCPFYKGDSLFNVDNRSYSNKIFMDTEDFKSLGDKTHRNQFGETEESTRRRLTYYNFCRDTIEEAVVHSFNATNKETIKREELKNFSSNLFWEKLKEKIGDATENIRPPEGHELIYGVIREKNFLSEMLDNNKEEESIVVTVEKYTCYKNIGLELKNYNIKIRRLKITKNLIVNFKNTINPPYFFIGVSKKGEGGIKGKRKHRKPELIRLFIHPIHYDNQHIAFVESGYERLYAKSLFEKKTPFLKPMSGNEHYRIKKELRNYTYYDKTNQTETSKALFLKYRPDFIEFYKDHLLLVEVSGYDNKEYTEHLEVKSKYYKRLEDTIEIVRYKEIKGTDLEKY